MAGTVSQTRVYAVVACITHSHVEHCGMLRSDPDQPRKRICTLGSKWESRSRAGLTDMVMLARELEILRNTSMACYNVTTLL